MTSHVVDRDEFARVLTEAKGILASEPSLIMLPSRPTVFVGDTHGDSDSTEEVFRRFLGSHLIVFEGDYVDRAPATGSSTYNLMGVLQKKVEHPKDVVLLRGNHEFAELWRYGFQASLDNRDMLVIRPKILQVMSELPYAAMTPNGVLALHAGVPNVESLDDIKAVPKGLVLYQENKIACQLVWNDSLLEGMVNPVGQDFAPNTKRGFDDDHSIIYGQRFLDEKLAAFGAKVLVRGHDYHAKGHGLNDKILTIFTSQEYAKDGPMKGRYVAVLDPAKTIQSTKDLEIVQL
ncbi:MAG: metallophosphoesterase [Nanoarchaeota archaeon]